MAQLNQPFDPNQADEWDPSKGSGGGPLPAGWYTMQITEDQMKPTKAGNGAYLEMTLEIVESAHPDRRGRRVWVRLNLSNPNQKAVQIAQAQLRRITEALGHVGVLQDTSVLHFRPLDVLVEIRESDTYGPSNEVRDFAPAGSRAGGDGTAPMTNTRPQNTNGRSAPWGS